MFRSSNPTLSAATIRGVRGYTGENAMTVQGVINKSAILLLLALFTASWMWKKFLSSPEAALGFLILGLFAGFIIALVTVFKKDWARVTAPIYALLEGLVLGGITVMFEKSYPGIAYQAITLTFAVFASLLIAYKSDLIKVTNKMRLGIVAATGGIALFYFIAMILGFFGVGVPLINSASPLGIGFSIVVVIIASLNLVLDFDFIANSAKAGMPKYMEWYAAFGLLVTLVWLYIEILRLLSKLRRRR